MVKFEVPAVVGVPEITPVEELIDSPAGSVPTVTENVYGGVPPVACTVALYAALAVPFVSEVV